MKMGKVLALYKAHTSSILGIPYVSLSTIRSDFLVISLLFKGYMNDFFKKIELYTLNTLYITMLANNQITISIQW